MEGLPHLDNGPEIYETSDIDSIEELGKIEQGQNEDINQSSLNAATAQAKFESESERAIIFEDSVDFSGNLDHPEMGSSGYTVRKQKETREQKLKRIAQELDELQSEDKAEQDSLRIYQQTLDQLLQSPENGTFTEKISSLLHGIETEMDSLHDENMIESFDCHKSPVSNPDADILEFEARINEIEKLLGLQTLGDHKSLNLHNHLLDLERKVEFIFDPDFEVQAIKDKIESMNSELDALDIKKRVTEIKHGTSEKQDSSVFQKSVNSLYQQVEAMEKYENILPHMIARLKTLNGIHLDLAGKTQAISGIDSTLDTISQDLCSWNDNLNQMNKALDDHAKTFKDNVDYVDNKVSNLEQKLGDINKN